MIEVLTLVLEKNALLAAFVLIGLVTFISYWIAERLTRGWLHGSAIAIMIGLVLAYIGGVHTGGKLGLADISIWAGVGFMGGAMLRDFAIVSTAFGARLENLKGSGTVGVISVFLGVVLSFVVGALIAVAFGYRDAVSITTIGAGAATYIVGPVTGTAIGASSEVIALSIGAGLVKAIAVMIATPVVAGAIGLNNPKTAMIFGGLMGTNSGVAGGLAATDTRLVPYGVMTATFYTGLGCLLAPSVLYLSVRFIVG